MTVSVALDGSVFCPVSVCVDVVLRSPVGDFNAVEDASQATCEVKIGNVEDNHSTENQAPLADMRQSTTLAALIDNEKSQHHKRKREGDDLSAD